MSNEKKKGRVYLQSKNKNKTTDVRTKRNCNRRIALVGRNKATGLGLKLQSNPNSSNTDDSFIMANSNSFLSSYEILPIAQENKYLGKFSYFIMKSYAACTH